ncbi:hypothetical protein V8F06_013990 [Rhypophila decipiens]
MGSKRKDRAKVKESSSSSSKKRKHKLEEAELQSKQSSKDPELEKVKESLSSSSKKQKVEDAELQSQQPEIKSSKDSEIIQELRQTVNDRDAEIASLQKKLDGALSERDEKVASLQKRLDETLNERDERIASLQKELDCALNEHDKKTVSVEKEQVDYTPNGRDEKIASLQKKLDSTLNERDEKVASLERKIDCALSVIKVQEDLAANDAFLARLGEDVDAIRSTSADNLWDFPYRDVTAQTERIRHEIKATVKHFAKQKEYLGINDAVRASCGRPGPKLAAWSVEYMRVRAPERIAAQVGVEFRLCERVLGQQAKELRALSVQVEKLKEGRLGQLMGKTIRDFLE